jgi:alpha-tubulin suppressor-like RCC1 family protein
MSQTKAQLIQPIGVVTASGVVVSGVMTAGTFDGDVVGSATSIIQGTNLNLGAFNATSFAGDFTGNATGIITSSAIKVGSLTASSFVGDFTGTATSMAKGTGFKAGTVTATPADVTYTVTVSGGDFYLNSLQQPTPSLYPGATYTFDQSDSTNGTHPLRLATAADAAGSTEYTFQVTTNGTPGSAGAYTRIVVSPSAPDTLYYYCSSHSGMGGSINITNLLQGPVTGAVTGDVKGNISGNVTGNVTGNAVGAAGSVLSGSNIHVGVMTATSYSGDGSALTGIAATNFNTQTVAAVGSATTTIDLSAGNCITFNQLSNRTVAFANTSTSMDVTIIRGTSSSGTITWPDSVKWNGGSAPTLISGTQLSNESQQFQLLTRDSGVTWYAWENMKKGTTLKYNLFSFGSNEKGQLGINLPGDSYNFRSSPVQIPGVWAHVNNQNDQKRSVHATKPDGTLWAWGANGYGSLGLNSPTSDDKSSPTQVGTNTNWSLQNIGGSGNGVNITKTDGTLWTMGYNNQGELGHNNRTKYSSPTQVGSDTTWATSLYSIMRSNEGRSAAIKTDGTLWVWGYNDYGTLGLNQKAPNRPNVSSPTQVGTDTTWSKIDGGRAQVMMGIKTDGTLWSWGRNYAGALGLNTRDDHRSSPVQVGTDTTWDNVNSGGYSMSFATKTDGTGWIWGYGEYGSGGMNINPMIRSSPVQLPGTWNQGSVALFSYALATKADGTMWAWGRNRAGQLGDNTIVTRSSPIQIPGTTWRYSWSSTAVSYGLKDAE